MIEYEYRFIVDDIQKYINYCEENNYIKIEDTIQLRKLYKNKSKGIARIITNIINKRKITYLDFKDDNDRNELFKSSKETLPLKITKGNEKQLYSITRNIRI